MDLDSFLSLDVRLSLALNLYPLVGLVRSAIACEEDLYVKHHARSRASIRHGLAMHGSQMRRSYFSGCNSPTFVGLVHHPRSWIESKQGAFGPWISVPGLVDPATFVQNGTSGAHFHPVNCETGSANTASGVRHFPCYLLRTKLCSVRGNELLDIESRRPPIYG